MDTTVSVRIPPHSSEVEESVLGALLIDRDAVIAVAEFLRPDNFYDERHKKIYECCLALYEERVPIDVLTVAERLKKIKFLKEVGGATYLAELANKVPTAAHVEHYGRIVKESATKRSLMTAASKLLDLSLDEGLKLVSGALIYSASKDSGTEGLEMKVISPDKIQKVFLKK